MVAKDMKYLDVFSSDLAHSSGAFLGHLIEYILLRWSWGTLPDGARGEALCQEMVLGHFKG